MKTYNRVLNFARPYSLTVLLSLLSSFLYVIINALSLWMISTLVSNIMIPNIETKQLDAITFYNKLELYLQSILGQGTQLEQLKSLCIMLLICFLLKNLFFYINNISLAYVQNNMISDIRNKLFKHLQTLPLSFFENMKTAEISSIFIRDVSAMRMAFTQTVQKLINEPINILVFLTMLIIINFKLTIIILFTVPLSIFIIIKLGQSIRRKVKRSSEKIAGIMNVLNENIVGVKIVKSFTTENKELDRFQLENNRFYELIIKTERLRALITPINDMIGVTLGVFLLWIGGNEVLKSGTMSSESFLRYVIFLFAMLQPARKLGNVYALIQSGLGSAERVFKILDTKTNIIDLPKAKTLKSFNKKLVFKNVNFYYNNNKLVLKNINLSINKGEIVAIVGASGSGKTTMTDLISRFYNISSGEILIDDININNISLYSLRNIVGIVPQRTILFNDTISNNIAYGEKNNNHQNIKLSSDVANATEFINKLPHKFETKIGEQGIKLSGGQCQRLSIARAIYKNPSILILDEATSSLDTESEKKVQEAIDNIVKDRTVIVIAHRLSTITKADKIIVLDKGEIAEIGRHNELIKQNGIYSQLYNIQFKGCS